MVSITPIKSMTENEIETKQPHEQSYWVDFLTDERAHHLWNLNEFILRKYSDYANPLTYSYYIYIDETKCYTFEENIDRATDKSFDAIFPK